MVRDKFLFVMAGLFKKLNATGVYGALCIGLLLLVVACLRVGFERERFVLHWAYTHYLFNYRDGFVKRGFIGEILRLLSIDISYSFLQVFTIALLAIFCVIFIAYLVVLMLKSVNKYAGLLLVLLLGLSSFSLQHFLFDIGRFDIVSYSLLLLLMGCLLATRAASTLLTAMIMSAFVSVVLLVHEANFFMVVPMAIACWYIACAGFISRMLQVTLMFFALVLTYFISTYGAYTVLDHDGHLQALRDQYGPWVVRSSVRVIHDITLQDNVLLTLWHVVNAKHLMHHIVFFILSLPLAIVLCGLFAALKSVLGKAAWLLLVASFTPLLLYPIGLDHFRWWSLSLFNFFLMVSFVSLVNGQVFTAVAGLLLRRQRLIWFVILLALLLGPLRTSNSFSVVESLLVNQFGF